MTETVDVFINDYHAHSLHFSTCSLRWLRLLLPPCCCVRTTHNDTSARALGISTTMTRSIRYPWGSPNTWRLPISNFSLIVWWLTMFAPLRSPSLRRQTQLRYQLNRSRLWLCRTNFPDVSRLWPTMFGLALLFQPSGSTMSSTLPLCCSSVAATFSRCGILLMGFSTRSTKETYTQTQNLECVLETKESGTQDSWKLSTIDNTDFEESFVFDSRSISTLCCKIMFVENFVKNQWLHSDFVVGR